jgi:hypothetical protein
MDSSGKARGFGGNSNLDQMVLMKLMKRIGFQK